MRFLPIIDLRDGQTFHDMILQVVRQAFQPAADDRRTLVASSATEQQPQSRANAFTATVRRLRKQMIAPVEMCQRKACRLEGLGVADVYGARDTPAEIREAIARVAWNPLRYLEDEDVVRGFLEQREMGDYVD